MKILSIDVGIINFAFTFWNCEKLIDFEKIDITNFIKENEKKCIAIYMKNLFEKISYFKEANSIIIERQPFSGIIAVQEIILSKFYDKCILISPIKMHKYFDIDHLDYDHRKMKTIEIASPYIHDKDKYKKLIRKHDIADSVCIYLYWKNNEKEELFPFEKFEYTPNAFKDLRYKKTNT